jgi:hypothetical protein
MERGHAKLCIVSSFSVNGEFDPSLCPCWLLMYVIHAILKGNNFVGVLLVFKRLAYGMFDTNFEGKTCKKWLCL